MSEKNIESILIEQRSFPPAESFVNSAQLQLQPEAAAALYAEAEQRLRGLLGEPRP